MSWYDPTSWSAKDVLLGGPIGGALSGEGYSIYDHTLGDDPGANAENQRKNLLYGQANAAGQFGDQQQGAFAANQTRATQNMDALQQQANGQNSVSAEQLRLALGRNQATQMSLAAGASPQNAAAAARTAAINSARVGAGLAGQQSVAGMQERNQAQQALSGAIGTYGGQALSAAQGARGQAITGYGAGNSGAPEKSWLEKYGPAISSGAALAASDRRLKTGIKDGDASANKMLDALRSFDYSYKDEDTFGAGKRTGVMAQDLERAGIKHAVVDTPAGKMVHGAHLSTANTAMIAALQRRLTRVEQER